MRDTADPEPFHTTTRSQVFFRMRLGPELSTWWVELRGKGAPGTLLRGPYYLDGTGDLQRVISMADGHSVYQYDGSAGGIGSVSPYDPARCPAYATDLLSRVLGGRAVAEWIRQCRITAVAQDAVQGQDCYKLTASTRITEGLVPGSLTVWVAPERSFMPLRTEYLAPRSANTQARTVIVDTRQELVEAGQGLWIPTHCERQVFTQTGTEYLWERTAVQDLVVAEVGPGSLELSGSAWSLALPIGTEVWQPGASKPDYVVGNLDSLADEFAIQPPPPLEFD